MKNIIIILVLALMTATASAETGIVLNDIDMVQYKYDTDTRPSLQPGEYIVVHADINSVLKGATYKDGVFVNPVPPVPTPTPAPLILKTEQPGIDPTQTIISGLTGAGAAYLMVRRKKAA